jgi:hypothetical protein
MFDYLLIAGAVGYCLVHFLAYIVIVRETLWGRSERGILLYHAGSFLFLFLSALSASGLSIYPSPVAVVVSAIAVHGVYRVTMPIYLGIGSWL